ncbi:MAG: methylmalonyl-CoA epimerase [Acidobacteria bacterium]|nr:methylmalonyl-CoA epimerase [Acidobacteriota bacterium]
MKAVLDHVGIAVGNLADALSFYRDALGLEIEAPEEVASQRVRAHFVPTGPSSLELLEATAPDSPIARFVGKRGPGLHHITLRVENLQAALAQLKARGVRLIDEQPRPGAEGSIVAFIHPSSAHGVLVELKQRVPREEPAPVVRRLTLGDLELISLSDGFFRLDGGAMFGVVPKVLWSRHIEPDDRNRIRLGLRPLVVRGARTMLIDAGVGDKLDAKLTDIYGLERASHLDHSLAAAGLTPESIDIVLATHLHFDHAGGLTMRGDDGRIRPRFPRAQYVIRRGEWEDAMTPNQRTRASYFPENYAPLAEARVLQLVDADTTIMPGVKVRRSGGHTPHHQVVVVESGGHTAVFAADLVPTVAHLPEPWVMGYDLLPLDTMRFKATLLAEAVKGGHVMFFEHDPEVAAGIVVEEGGKRWVERVL